MELINDNIIFGLDIGTRSIVGIVGIKENKGFKVIASHVELHETRSMIDGQIHDIEQVAITIALVRDVLELKIGKKLKKVCIAAAGRVLKTMHTTVDIEIEDDVAITKEQILSLELQGMEKAMHKVNYAGGSDDIPFYCVGYSVTNYYLNDYIMKNLEDHKGSNIKVDVLSTFLPSEVVNSLYNVIDKAGLEVYSLTLEPIAAIEVAIPKSYRLLNIALIDIGAGTSDIAITKGGSIIAYGMIPYAGDEITESIIHEYLVDFKTAEKIKIKASGKSKTVSFKDAIGMKQTINLEEVRNIMETSKISLAKHLSDKIKELNDEQGTNAVFIVGGGGQIKGFEEILAKELDLPRERVAIRGKDVLTNISSEDKDFKKKPEFVTPIGICLTGINNNQHDFVEVFLNDESIRIFNTNRLKVMDIVALKGIDPKSFISKHGKSLNYTLNNEAKTIRGNMGIAARIYINQKEANLSTPIKMYDYINIIAAVDGSMPNITIKDVLSENYITINGDKKILEITIKVNKQPTSKLKNINEGDVIELIYPSIGDLLESFNVDYTHVFINENECKPSTIVKFNDVIVTFVDDKKLLHNDVKTKIKTNTNENDEQGRRLTVVVNKKTISLTGKEVYKFIDIFDFIDFDRTKAKGTIIATINGERCSYMDLINHGDTLEIYWKDNQNN